MNKYIAPVIVIIIISFSAIFMENYVFTIIHIILFMLLTIVLLVLSLLVYGIINYFLDFIKKKRIGLVNFGVVSSIILVISVVLATPSLCMPLLFRTVTENFADGFLDDVPIQVELNQVDMTSKDYFLVDGFKFNVPKETIYSRGNKPFRNIQLSSNEEDKVYIMKSSNENLGDSLLSTIKEFAYSGKHLLCRGESLIQTATKLSSKSNYEIYKTIAMTRSKDVSIGDSLAKIYNTYEMILIKLLTLPGNLERESYYFESDKYSALLFGTRADFYKDNRSVTLIFAPVVPIEKRLFILTHACFDEGALTDNYTPTNIPSCYDDQNEITWYEYGDVDKQEIPVGALVFKETIGIEPNNKLSMRLDIGISEEEDILFDQIIFKVDNDYDEIRIRNEAVDIIEKEDHVIVSKELFCGNYKENTDDLVTKDIDFFKKLVASKNAEIKFVAKGYTKTHQLSENDKIELNEFIDLYEKLLPQMR